MNRFLDVLAVLALLAMIILSGILVAIPIRSKKSQCDFLGAALAPDSAPPKCDPNGARDVTAPSVGRN